MAKYKTLLTCSVIFGCILVTQLNSCRDKGIEPKPNPEPKDYKVYFAEPGSSPPFTLFAFHPTTQKIDSSQLGWNPRAGAIISADGARLYVSDRTNVYVLDAKTLTKLTKLPYPTDWPVSVSPDNNLVGIVGNDLTILRASDYSVVFSDTDLCETGCFSSDSKAFFCDVGWGVGPGLVYTVDLVDSGFPVKRKAFADGGVLQVVPSSDNSKWFLYLNAGSVASAFAVYAVASDSIIFRQNLSPGFGHFAVMPNGKNLFYTNPGTMISDVPSPLNFTIFDIQQNAVTKIVRDSALFTVRLIDGNDYPFPPNEVVVTPDNRWLILLGGDSPGRVVYLYDILNDSLVYRQVWGGVPTELTVPSVQLDQ